LALRREFYAEASLGQGIVIRVWLEGDGPLVEELELSLMLAAGRDTRRDTTLAKTAHLLSDFFKLLSQFLVVE
jgi:hypothetical protein